VLDLAAGWLAGWSAGRPASAAARLQEQAGELFAHRECHFRPPHFRSGRQPAPNSGPEAAESSPQVSGARTLLGRKRRRPRLGRGSGRLLLRRAARRSPTQMGQSGRPASERCAPEMAARGPLAAQTAEALPGRRAELELGRPQCKQARARANGARRLL